MGKGKYTDSIGAILLRRGVIMPNAYEGLVKDAEATGTRIEKLLAERKVVAPDDITLAIAEYLNMRPIKLSHFVPPPQLLETVPTEVMSNRLAMPVARVGRMLSVALADPFDLMALDELASITNLDIVPLVASEAEITAIIDRLTSQSSSGLDMDAIMQDDSELEVVESDKDEVNLEEMLETAEGAPVIRMVNMILIEALRTGASDIHIEPMERSVRLRYRIDGKLIERPGPPKTMQNAVISRIKIMSDLDIAERRKPQDGRTHIKGMGKEVDLRISILPTVHGEKIVIRTLDQSTLLGGVDNLGLDPVSLKAFKYALDQPNGIILVTGPTGSGKTMTLYSCLQDLNQIDTNIITCEDPVEFQIPGLNQVAINADVGLSFASALRSILRQDPDKILVGELRDYETAHIAIEAALTGHLVLATLHTNNSAQAVTRLIDMKIEPFMLGSSLILAQAQRLFRRLCTACKKASEIDAAILEANQIDPEFFKDTVVYAAKGCPRCNGLGFKGRGSIMEVLLVTDEIREAILRNATATELMRLARQNGLRTLKESGLYRVKEGVTSLEAALEVTGGG